jgi:hypothetical protein
MKLLLQVTPRHVFVYLRSCQGLAIQTSPLSNAHTTVGPLGHAYCPHSPERTPLESHVVSCSTQCWRHPTTAQLQSCRSA